MSASLARLLGADFFLYALAAGLMLALTAGPLGSFVVWRRMAFFGDTLAHSALLGVAIGLAAGGDPQLAIVLSSLALALLLVLLERRSAVPLDALLGVLAHGMLAVGVVLLALTGGTAGLEAYLFGALLTITGPDLAWVAAAAGAAGAFLLLNWNALVSLTVHADLARVEGVPVDRLKAMLTVAIALTVAVSMKVVGVLLITSLLIIPPAAARRLSRSPEQMAARAGAVGAASVAGGLGLSFAADVPPGPAVVATALGLFVLAQLVPESRGSAGQGR